MKIIIKEFFRVAKKYKIDFFKSIFLILFLSILSSVVPFAFRYFLDYSTEVNDYKILILFIFVFLLYFLLKTFITILWYVSLDNFGGKYMSDTIVAAQAKMLNSMDFLTIENEKNTKLKHVLYVDVLNAFTSIGHHLPSIISALLVIIILIVLSFFINYKFSLILFLGIVLGIALSFVSRKKITESSSISNKYLKNLNYNTSNFLESVSIAKLNKLDNYFENLSRNSVFSFIKAVKKEDSKTYMWAGLSSGYMSLFSYFISALLVLPLFDGTLLNYALLTIICSLAIQESETIVNNFRLLFKSVISFKNIDTILSSVAKNVEYLKEINSIKGENVNFKIEDKQIIRNLNFNFKKGEMIRIKGINGSGKSTLVKMIVGLYENDSIIYNNSEKKSPLKKTLFIEQNELLLNETVCNYLSIITGESIDDAMKAVFAKKLKLDRNIFDKNIENFGENLSNGELKKIQIIRLMLDSHKKDLIILDEIMSGLDASTRKIYLSYLQELKKQNKIIILIEHERLEFNFDQVLEMKNN